MSNVNRQQAVLEEWAGELSKKLGRPAHDIISEGLSAPDFSPSRRVEITLADKSFCRFHYAFSVIDETKQQVATFTEHCGYHVFPLSGAIVKEINETIYVSEDKD